MDCSFEEVTDLFNDTSLPSHPQFRVFTSSKHTLENKLSTFSDDGVHKLKVVTDFDFTLTRFNVPVPAGSRHPQDGPGSGTLSAVQTHRRGLSCHKVLEYSGFLSDEDLQKVRSCYGPPPPDESAFPMRRHSIISCCLLGKRSSWLLLSD
jgi:hypothetical protein